MAGQASPRRRSLWCHHSAGNCGCSGHTCTPARCRCGHEGLWPCHLQGETSPTHWEIPSTMGPVVVLLLSFPVTPSRLHSCNLTQGLQILPTPAQPPGRAQPLLLALQVGRTHPVKVRKEFGIRERGREKCGYHHGRLGAAVDASCRAPSSCGRRPLQ